jgi:hypothetical protein
MLTEADRAQLEQLGISAAEAARQLRLFAAPPPATALDRPCTVGDGIAVLDDADRRAALQAYERAAAAGRLLKFIPASGAATRMFQALLAVRPPQGGELTRRALEARAAGGDKDAGAALTFVDNVRRFAFSDALTAAVARRGEDLAACLRRGELTALIAALLDADGLDYAASPKALIAFHRYAAGSRTAFEEHLLEGAAYARSSAAIARLHFTVSPEHADAYRAVLDAVRARSEARAGARFEVGFSFQSSATDTLAVDLDNRPLRDADGRLVLRPGGHGALIENLHRLAGDVVFLKTVDNIQPEHRRAAALEWMRILTGHLLVVQEALFAHRAALDRSPPQSQLDAALAFLRGVLGAPVAEGDDVGALRAALDRPLRVCGMVRNSGEPGGGPFWVRGGDGQVTRQIVESAQVDQADAVQRARFAAATHFNPVLIACGVRDWRGRPFDLAEFVDPAAVFIARKSKDGAELKALERPGLWNGAMASWHTLFVELPDAVFTPVKSVNDLLRPEHQPAEDAQTARAARE